MRTLEGLGLSLATGLSAVGLTNKYLFSEPANTNEIADCYQKTFFNIFSCLPPEQTGLNAISVVRGGKSVDVSTFFKDKELSSTAVKFITFLTNKFGVNYFARIKDGVDSKTQASLEGICRDFLNEQIKREDEFGNHCLIAATGIVGILIAPRLFSFLKGKAAVLPTLISKLLKPRVKINVVKPKQRPKVLTSANPDPQPSINSSPPSLPPETQKNSETSLEKDLEREWNTVKKNVISGNTGKRVRKF